MKNISEQLGNSEFDINEQVSIDTTNVVDEILGDD